MRNSERWFYNYSVDVMSAWLYYNPIYALQELVVQELSTGTHDWETIGKMRAVGALTHALVMRPVGMMRNHLAKKLGVDQNSSLVDKLKVNLLSYTPIQAVTYGVIVAAGMGWADNQDVDTALNTWTAGVAIGAFYALGAAPFQDDFRKRMGIEKAIKDVEKVTLE